MLNSRLNLADIASLSESRANLGLSNVCLQMSNNVHMRAASVVAHVLGMNGMYTGEILAFDASRGRLSTPSWANLPSDTIDVGGFANDAGYVRAETLAAFAFTGDLADATESPATESPATQSPATPEWWKISHVIAKLERPHLPGTMLGVDVEACRSNLGVHPLQTLNTIESMEKLAVHDLYLGDPVTRTSVLAVVGNAPAPYPMWELLSSTNGFVRMDGLFVPFTDVVRDLFQYAQSRIAAKLTFYENTVQAYDALLHEHASNYITKTGHLNDAEDLDALRQRLAIGTHPALTLSKDALVWTSGELTANLFVCPALATREHGGERPNSERFEPLLVGLSNGRLTTLANSHHPEAIGTSEGDAHMGRVRVRYQLSNIGYPVDAPPEEDFAAAPSYPAFYSSGVNIVIRAQNIYQNVIRNPLTLEYDSLIADSDTAHALRRTENLGDLVEDPAFDKHALDDNLQLHALAYDARYDNIVGRPTALSMLRNDLGVQVPEDAFLDLDEATRARVYEMLQIGTFALRNSREDNLYAVGHAMHAGYARVRQQLKLPLSDAVGDPHLDFVGCAYRSGRFEPIPRASEEEDVSDSHGTVRLGTSFRSTRGVATAAMLLRMTEEIDARCRPIVQAIKSAYAMRGLDPYQMIPPSRHHHLDL